MKWKHLDFPLCKFVVIQLYFYKTILIFLLREAPMISGYYYYNNYLTQFNNKYYLD